jgi:hypothetical protein
MKKTLSLTLMEVVVALSLSLPLICFLSSLFYQICREQAQLEPLVVAIEERQSLHMRLNQLFASLAAKDDKTVLYTKKNDQVRRIYLRYHVAADPDPCYIGFLEGELCYSSKELSFQTYPNRKQLLLTDLSGFSIEFFNPEKCEWTKDWSEKIKESPPIIRCRIEKKKEKAYELFFFPLLSSSWIVLD